jgi:streptogramin lyase
VTALARILRRWSGTKRTPHRRGVVPAVRLSLESLEDRTVPSTVITEIPLQPFAFNSQGIATGPDLNVWFTETNTGKIGRSTASGMITEFALPTSFSSPTAITTGPDGNLWFIEAASNKIGRITPAGAATEFPVATGNRLDQLLSAPDGNLWFTTLGGSRTISTPEIGRITPLGSVTLFAVPATHIFNGWTVGPDGNLWAAGSTVPSTPPPVPEIGLIVLPTSTNPNPTFTFFTTGLTGVPGKITSGPDSKLWFTENTGATIGTSTTGGTITEYAIPASNTALGPIVAGPDGKLWFTEGNNVANIKIGRISTAGALEAEFISPTKSGGNNSPSGLVVGPHGTLWFSELNNNQLGVVQNVLDGNPLYVERLYENVLGRFGSSADLDYWSTVINYNGLPAGPTGIQHSDEAHIRVVRGWYQTYLGRPADPLGLQYYVNLLKTQTEEMALSMLLASPEYYTHVGGSSPTDATFAQGLIHDLLGRAPYTNDLKYWQDQIKSNSGGAQGRMAVAQMMQATPEYRIDVIQLQYLGLLHRTSPASQAEVFYWLALNLDTQSLKIAFEETAEFALNG